MPIRCNHSQGLGTGQDEPAFLVRSSQTQGRTSTSVGVFRVAQRRIQSRRSISSPTGQLGLWGELSELLESPHIRTRVILAGRELYNDAWKKGDRILLCVLPERSPSGRFSKDHKVSSTCATMPTAAAAYSFHSELGRHDRSTAQPSPDEP
jgi:hypothetical protein